MTTLSDITIPIEHGTTRKKHLSVVLLRILQSNNVTYDEADVILTNAHKMLHRMLDLETKALPMAELPENLETAEIDWSFNFSDHVVTTASRLIQKLQ